jgi:hypothetical protein
MDVKLTPCSTIVFREGAMRFFVQAFVLAFVFGSFVGPAKASKVEQLTVSKTVVLNASASAVWQALKAVRAADSPQHHVVSHAGVKSEVQENFVVPVMGAVSCVYAEHEIECRKVEYRLIRSANFVAFEGAWEIIPCAGGTRTNVTLTSLADTGSHIPFASKITREQTAQLVEKRINELRATVERQTVAVSLNNN